MSGSFEMHRDREVLRLLVLMRVTPPRGPLNAPRTSRRKTVTKNQKILNRWCLTRNFTFTVVSVS